MFYSIFGNRKCGIFKSEILCYGDGIIELYRIYRIYIVYRIIACACETLKTNVIFNALTLDHDSMKIEDKNEVSPKIYIYSPSVIDLSLLPGTSS